MKRIYLLVLLAIILSVASGCKPRRPSGIISPKKMENILVDYHLAQGVAENMNAENEEVQRYLLVQSVFRKYGLTEAEFDSSLVYYCARAEEMNEIYTNVLQRIRVQSTLYNSDSEHEQNIYANLTQDGDTANIWQGREGACLLPNKLQNNFRFSITADSTFRKGDSFIWHLRTQFVSQGYMNDAVAMLRLEYENDTVVCTTMNIGSSMAYDLIYNSNKALDTIPLRNVSGFVYLSLKSQNDFKFQMMLLQELSLIRMHKETPLPEPADTAKVDSIATDSLHADSIPANYQPHVRLTPTQIREQQPRERKIDVVKEKPIRLSKKRLRR